MISMLGGELMKTNTRLGYNLKPNLSGQMAEASLVFPPLMNTGFGTYYPSTAVLAGYLESVGVSCTQTSLNEEAALYLLKPSVLNELATGQFFPHQTLPLESPPVVAARTLLRSRHLLFDQEGRHAFRGDIAGPGYLLKALAQPYLIDITLREAVKRGLSGWARADWYRQFYEYTGYVEILPSNIQIVGITVPMGPQLIPALILAEQIHKLKPDIAVVLGGPSLSLMDIEDVQLLLETFTCVSAIVRFDGELPLAELVRQRRNNRWRPAEIPGVSSRVNQQVVHCPPGRGLSLHDMPYAKYDEALMSRLIDVEVGIIQTRGCYWGKCTYCDFVELYEGSPHFRNRSPKSFADEICYQTEKHDARRFSLITEAIPPAFAKNFSNIVLEKGLQIRWGSFAMVDRRFTRETLELMAKAGCDNLVIGVETMTDRVLKLVEKSATREENIRFLTDASNAGIRLYVNLIPDLPSTTYQEAMDSLAVFNGLKHYLSGVAVFPFEATKSSAIGRAPEKFGLRTAEAAGSSGQAEYANNHLNIIDSAMTPAERLAVHQAYRAFANEVGAPKTPHFERVAIAITDENAVFRLAREYIDVVEIEGGAQICNWLMRQSWRVASGWMLLIKSLESNSTSFSRREFIKRFPPPEVGEFLLNELLEHGVVMPVEPS
jgi:Radical SAM superfamily